MYLSNKYTICYYQIIDRARSRILSDVYFERHHIIPKSLGGLNNKDNIVQLTAKEHFVCHRLLTKMTQGTDLLKMKRAVWRMAIPGSTLQKRFKPNARTYEFLRLEFGFLKKGIKTPDNVRQKISEANKGKNAWNKGVPRTLAEKQKMSASRLLGSKNKTVWNKGKHHSEGTLQKIKERAKFRVPITCVHCKLSCSPSNHKRWHGDNCKLNTL